MRSIWYRHALFINFCSHNNSSSELNFATRISLTRGLANGVQRDALSSVQRAHPSALRSWGLSRVSVCPNVASTSAYVVVNFDFVFLRLVAVLQQLMLRWCLVLGVIVHLDGI
jgi:hypothetical protein